MNRLLILPVLLLTLLVGNPAFSADLQKGLDAAQKGNFATALREWKPLAEQGDADAQYNLGVMYYEGYGVPEDNKTAVKWFRLAAEQGVASAQYFLGWMYYNGYGVLRDSVYAHMWANISASNGDEDAIQLRDFLANEIMTSADISEAQKLALECVAKDYKN